MNLGRESQCSCVLCYFITKYMRNYRQYLLIRQVNTLRASRLLQAAKFIALLHNRLLPAPAIGSSQRQLDKKKQHQHLGKNQAIKHQ